MIVLFECECCGGEVAVNYAKSASKDYMVQCDRCCAVYTVDHDAENDDGTWKDLTRLHQYKPNKPQTRMKTETKQFAGRYGKTIVLNGGYTFEVQTEHREWLDKFAPLFEQAPTLKAQRDELLAALEAIVNAIQTSERPVPMTNDIVNAFNDARAAIAKAGGKDGGK